VLSRQSGKVMVIVFASFFLIPGLVVVFFSFVPFFKYISSQNWKQVDAFIVDVKQTSSSGDGSTTYGVTGSYQYKFEEDTYQSSRLSFYSGEDNLGNFQQQFYRKLKNAQSKNTALTAWVNPDSPGKAFLDRTIRGGVFAFKFLFGLVFSVVGGGIILLSRYAEKRSLETERLSESYPDTPWRWRPEWQTNVIKPNAGLQFKGLFGFAVFWNLISMPAAGIVFFGEQNHPIWVKLLILLFPLIGLSLIYMAVKAYKLWKKYGAATLHMKPAPFSIGHESTGEVKIPGIRVGEEFILTLTCLEKTRRKSGKKTRTHTKILWQGDGRVKSGPGSDNVANLDYSFSLPANLPESMARKNNKSIEWKLLCQGASDSSIKLEFGVPAFVVKDQDATVNTNNANYSTWNEDTLKLDSKSYSSTTGDWKQLGVIQSKKDGGVHYYFPPGRNLKLLAFFPLFGAVFLAVGIWTYSAEAPFLFALVFGGLGLLFLVLGLNSLFFRSEIRIVEGELHVRRGMLRMKHVMTCAASDIHGFDISSNFRSNETRVYRLILKMLNGEKELLGKNLLVKSDVESLINQIQSDLGYPSERGTTG